VEKELLRLLHRKFSHGKHPHAGKVMCHITTLQCSTAVLHCCESHQLFIMEIRRFQGVTAPKPLNWYT